MNHKAGMSNSIVLFTQIHTHKKKKKGKKTLAEEDIKAVL